MNTAVKQQWIDALVGGNYAQTQLVLRNVRGYCCLGVLCDLYLKSHPDAYWKLNDDNVVYTFNTRDSTEESRLPTEVLEWAELRNCDPEEGLDEDSLIELNDEECLYFSEIAERIREYL